MKKSLLVIWLILTIGLLVSCSSQSGEALTPAPSKTPASTPSISPPTPTVSVNVPLILSATPTIAMESDLGGYLVVDSSGVFYKIDLTTSLIEKIAEAHSFDTDSSISPDGYLYYFESVDTFSSLAWVFRIDLQGNNLLQLTDDEYYNGGLSLCPGQDKLIYLSDRRPSGSESTIISLELNDFTTKVLYYPKKHISDIQCSPDGNKIAIVQSQELSTDPSKQTLSILDITSGKVNEVVSGEWVNISSQSWSRNSKMLIYGVPGKGIYRLGIETLEPELIPLVEEENFSFQLLAWSDDSRYILFESAQGEQAGVYLVDSVNLNIRSIDFGFQPNVEVTDYACQWAPNLDIFACVVGFSKIENKVLIGDVNGKLVKVFDLPELVEGQTNDLSWWPMVALYPEWKYKITRTGANLNVRDTYSTSAKSLTKLAQGAIFTTLEGPIAAEGYNWWRIRTEDGIEGWIVDVPGWYLLEGTP